ncbi:MAG: 3-oxoacyl-ACP synthase [Bacteroidota bacterium]
MIDRKKVYEKCMQYLNEHIHDLNDRLTEIRQSMEGESKSSAGDKHETSRAMLHLEQEKLGSQLQEALLQQNALQQYEHVTDTGTVKNGSLMHTDKGYIYLTVPLGKLHVGETDVMVISQRSPLGMQLLGKKVGDLIKQQAINFKILEIS